MCIIQEAEKNAKIDGFSNTVNEMILTNASKIYKITLIKTSIVEEDSYILAVLFLLKSNGMSIFDAAVFGTCFKRKNQCLYNYWSFDDYRRYFSSVERT